MIRRYPARSTSLTVTVRHARSAPDRTHPPGRANSKVYAKCSHYRFWAKVIPTYSQFLTYSQVASSLQNKFCSCSPFIVCHCSDDFYPLLLDAGTNLGAGSAWEGRASTCPLLLRQFGISASMPLRWLALPPEGGWPVQSRIRSHQSPITLSPITVHCSLFTRHPRQARRPSASQARTPAPLWPVRHFSLVIHHYFSRKRHAPSFISPVAPCLPLSPSSRKS
jgi:hypothetical protein